MIMRLFSLLFLASNVAAHSGLRALSVVQEEPQQQRSLQNTLDADQIAFRVLYAMEIEEMADGSTDRVAVNGEYTQFKNVADEWMLDQIQTVQAAQASAANAWALDTQGGGTGVSSFVEVGTYQAPRNHTIQIRYLVDFAGLTAPENAQAWVDSIRTEADLNTGELLAEIQGVTASAALSSTLEREGLPEGNLFNDAISLSTDDMGSWVAQASTSRTQFDNSYVIPYTLVWSITTEPTLATNTDYLATVNATREWLTDNFERVYGGRTNFEFQSIDIQLYYGQFVSQAGLYNQQVGMGVQILCGANDIADVPTLTSYTTTMQLSYSIPEFKQMLEVWLPEDSIFSNSPQVTYAILPTFEVDTLSNFVSRNAGPAPILPSIGLVSVVVDPDAVGGGGRQ